MRLIQALGTGETPTADEITDGLDALNAMLDSWWLERMAVFAIQERLFALTVGTQNYPIGPGAVAPFNVERPVKIETAYVRVSGVDYPLSVIDYDRWTSIGYKANQGIPQWVYYEPTVPEGELFLWPIPSVAMTLYLGSRLRIQSFTTSNDAINMPPGYVDALCFNLAVKLAPEYEREVPAVVGAEAIKTMANLKRLNATPPGIMMSDALYLDNRYDMSYWPAP
jgi:hypothetical protein